MNDTVSMTLAAAQVDVPKSSLGLFTLPCGLVDRDGVLHTEIQLQEMTGDEEDLLVSKTMSMNKKMTELMTRCSVRIGTIVDRDAIRSSIPKLPTGDRVYLMFAIRRVTLGDDYRITTKCPACKKEYSPTIDLSTLDIKPMPNPTTRVWEEELPSGKRVRLTVLTGEGEDRIEKLTKDDDKDAMSVGMLVRTEMLNGVPPTLQSIKALSSRDRNAIRKSFAAHEGGVDTSVEFKCPHCEREYKQDLDVQAGFFFPSAAPGS